MLKIERESRDGLIKLFASELQSGQTSLCILMALDYPFDPKRRSREVVKHSTCVGNDDAITCRPLFYGRVILSFLKRIWKGENIRSSCIKGRDL